MSFLQRFMEYCHLQLHAQDPWLALDGVKDSNRPQVDVSPAPLSEPIPKLGPCTANPARQLPSSLGSSSILSTLSLSWIEIIP